MIKGKRILVTGGAGFIGSHLVDRLSAYNDVVVFDDLSSGSLVNLGWSKSRISFVEGSILNRGLVKNTAKGMDIVFHLASNASVAKSIVAPDMDARVNVEGTLNLLRACENVERFVYSSSAAVYGDAGNGAVSEEHPTNPLSPYGWSKLAAEGQCHSSGLPIVVLRYFNVYGLRSNRGEYANVLSKFIRNMKRGKPLTVYGDGKQTRDFVYVDDVIGANILAALVRDSMGQVFNIASGIGVSISRLVESLELVASREAQVSYELAQAGEIKHSQGDIGKARRVLGYCPKTMLENGLRLVWEKSE